MVRYPVPSEMVRPLGLDSVMVTTSSDSGSVSPQTVNETVLLDSPTAKETVWGEVTL